MKALIVLALGVLLAGLQAKPINGTCPIKNQPVNPAITAEYKGKVIGFCCNSCKAKFANDPEAIAAKVPEFKAPAPKAPAPKPDAKPANTGACEVTKTAKGYYCLKCDRELTIDDVRGTECKKCETKPADIEYCVKRIPYYISKCQHKKREAKPFVCCNKPWSVPAGFDEDRARCTYECETCHAKANIATEIKHKDDCKPTFGGGLKKVCTKSGTAPHVGDDK
jgi:YHS domain-containing protein